MIRLFFLLLLAVLPAGCRHWGYPGAPPVPQNQVVDNFTKSESNDDSDMDSEDGSEGTFARKNDRSALPGSGLSDRSREIEERLGYK